ncbi:MAG: hypothetical protein JWP37_1469 [Mucilaginibacter sp.]|nr:hypothetical protein [Mucilaginibacter sp.]
MKSIRIVLVLLAFGLMILGTVQVKAQCAMCTTAVESNNKSGASTTKGLNNGIMYLLAAPYLAVAAVGIIWYKKYRRKNVNLNIRHEKLNMN